MGNDYYGHNEKLVLPDGEVTFGEDVLGWYLITLRYYHRYYKPVMHTETNVFDPEAATSWLWKQWVNVLRMRMECRSKVSHGTACVIKSIGTLSWLRKIIV